MSAERAFSPRPVEAPVNVVPIRPEVVIQPPTLPIPEPLPEGMIRFPVEQARPPRPFLVETPSPIQELYGYDIPLPHERSIIPIHIGRAKHEAKHLKLGLERGITPRGFSLNATDEYEAVVLFSKAEAHTKLPDFQIVAAAGAAGSDASGFGSIYQPGSDVHTVHTINQENGGVSVAKAIELATAELAKTPDAVWNRIVQIMAAIRESDDPTIAERLVKIAEWEVANGIEAKATVDTEAKPATRAKAFGFVKTPGEYVYIDNGEVKEHIVAVVEDEQEVLCTCGGRGMHSEKCPVKAQDMQPDRVYDLTKKLSSSRGPQMPEAPQVG